MGQISLEAARVNANLTQAELAEKLEVSRKTVIAWERGKKRMKAAYLYAFCQIVGMNEENIRLPEVEKEEK